MSMKNFTDLTYNEYQDKLVEEIIQHEPPATFESFTPDSSYCYGLGLNIVIHLDEINPTTINEAIRRFREVGEINWRATEAVPRAEVPFGNANAAFSRIRWELNTPSLPR